MKHFMMAALLGLLASASAFSADAQTVEAVQKAPVARLVPAREVGPGSSVSAYWGNDMGTDASDLTYNAHVPTASGNGGGGR